VEKTEDRRQKIGVLMNDSLYFKIIDWLISPEDWYSYTEPVLEGYRLIASKTDQLNAGSIETAAGSDSKKIERQFGMNPVKPYRDYYGYFRLITKMLPEEDCELEVKFAIGYTINNKLVTADDYSNFGWLRMAKPKQGMVYPNLSDQKQLLEFLLAHSRYPRFIITRVYHYLQFEIYEKLVKAISEREKL